MNMHFVQLKWVIHAPKPLILWTLRDKQDVEIKNASWLDVAMHLKPFSCFQGRSNQSTTLREIQNLRIIIPTCLMWFARDVLLVYNVHFSLDLEAFLWKRTETLTVLPVLSHFCCCSLRRCPHHAEWGSDYHLQIKWVMKVIAGKAEFANAPNWIIFFSKSMPETERGQRRSRYQEVKALKKSMERSWATNTEGIRGAAGTEERRTMSRSCEEKRVRQCKGGRKLLLEQLVTAETTRTPLPSSRAN